jgi:hypothetical protein
VIFKMAGGLIVSSDNEQIVLDTSYALAKQIPDMARGCAIHTAYGQIEIYPDEAEKLAKFVEKLLEKRLTKLTGK